MTTKIQNNRTTVELKQATREWNLAKANIFPALMIIVGILGILLMLFGVL